MSEFFITKNCKVFLIFLSKWKLPDVPVLPGKSVLIGSCGLPVILNCYQAVTCAFADFAASSHWARFDLSSWSCWSTSIYDNLRRDLNSLQE